MVKEDKIGEKEKRKKGVTNSIEKRRSWTADSSSLHHEITHVYWNSMSHYCVFKGPSTCPHSKPIL